MTPPDLIFLSIRRWAAYAAGRRDPEAWRNWARGGSDAGGNEKPDMSFVDPLLRRRLSSLSRMALRVAQDCIAPDMMPDQYVFCSRYGEYARSFEILQGLAKREAPSPMAFSMSVHNTAIGLHSMIHGDMSPSVSIAAGSATLEAAFVEAWAVLQEGPAARVLLVYHDERLPDLYRDQQTTVVQNAAFGMLLERADTALPTLSLEWKPHCVPDAADPKDPALEVLRLAIQESGRFERDDGRLRWIWNARAP